MIEIKHLHKYFNKNKSNEIHVINDTNLVFPKTGLVCLLGPSGCGKTTLLNVIGGLDKVDKGEIIIGDKIISKYKPNQWDHIRNQHFGYIFQNYILLQDLTIYQNLEFVLKMLNLDKHEIEERIDYALNAVGMAKYKKRKPNQLSGGQQQRIAIARALVKSPDVVIADEPTGNLDERNSTQIMNIIKKISKECLVVLVTHERRLAEFYGDVIIEISDGKIVKRVVVSQNEELYHLYDNNIYLKEFKKEEVDNKDFNVKYFYQDDHPKVELNIIFKDNTFYINSTKDNVNIKFIDPSSEIKVIDTKMPVIKQTSIEEFDYYLPKIKSSTKPSSSVIKYKDTFKMALAHLTGLRKRQKLLFLVFVLSAIMVVSGFINLFDSSTFEEKDFLTDNRNLVEITKISNYTTTDLTNLRDTLEVTHILGPASTLSYYNITFKIFVQSSGFTSLPTNALLPYDILDNPKLVLGRLPEKAGEAVIDKFLIDQMLLDDNFKANGVKYYEQFIGVKIPSPYFINESEIVGVVDTNNPNIYVTFKEYQISMINRLIINTRFSSPLDGYIIDATNTDVTHYYRYSDKDEFFPVLFPIEELVFNKNDILLSSHLKDSFNSNTIIIGSHTFTVIGFFENDYSNQKDFHANFIVSEQAIDDIYYNYISLNANASVYSNNKNLIISKLETKGLQGQDIYQLAFERYHTYNFNIEVYIFAIVVLSASLIFLFFIMRSSLIARIYEVGVYRALGVKKATVYKLFISEIILITLVTSVLGIVLASIFINKVNEVYPLIFYPWYISIVSFGFIFACNILVGLIPIRNLLKFTPSQILSKYDI